MRYVHGIANHESGLCVFFAHRQVCMHVGLPRLIMMRLAAYTIVRNQRKSVSLMDACKQASYRGCLRHGMTNIYHDVTIL